MNMRQITGFLLAVLTGASAAQAAFNLPRNGITWDATYEGTAHPGSESPSWAGFGGGGSASGGSDGNIWTQTTVTPSYLYFDQTDATWSSAGSTRTVEVRARVTDQTASDRVIDIVAGNGTEAYAISLSKVGSNTGVQLAGSVAIGSVLDLGDSDFHTFRLTVDYTSGIDEAKLYVDGNPTPIATSGSNPGFGYGNTLSFGDLSTGGLGGTSEIDFVSWTSGIQEVPEPSGLLLLTAALLPLRRRR